MKLFQATLVLLATVAESRKCPSPHHDAPKKFTVLHTNDIHSHMDQFNSGGTDCNQKKIDANQCYGGVARIKTVVDEFRKNSEDVILVDAGDQFQGTLFFNLYGGDKSAEAMNSLGYDVMTVGNHEFDTGLDKFAGFIDKLNFPVVSSNLGLQGTPLETKVQPYVILEKYNLGVIGYITKTTPQIVSSLMLGAVTVVDPIETVQKAVDELKAKGINRIICVSHNGYTLDQNLAESTSGIDIIVGGHSHSLLSNNQTLKDVQGRYPTPVKNLGGEETFIVQAHRFGDYLGHIDLEYDEHDVLISIQGEPILLDQNILPSAELYSKVLEWRAGFEVFKNDILTVSTAEFSADPIVCKGECAIGNIITRCMISEQAKKNFAADLSFINSGGIRAAIPSGNVSFADVMSILPFGNAVVALEWTGAQIKEVIEAVSAGKRKDGALVISSPQWAGVEFTIDSSRPEFDRVIDILIGGKKLDLAQKYAVLTVDFLAQGGDGIMPKEPFNPGDGLAETFASCLRTKASISPELLGYIHKI
jgi:5'-nucleotidase